MLSDIRHIHHIHENNDTHRLSHLSFHCQILCGIPGVTQDIMVRLERLCIVTGLSIPTIPIQLIIDTPSGFALHRLEAMRISSPRSTSLTPSSCRPVVLSSNSCVEYLEDLWDLQPHVLLIGSITDRQLTEATNLACRHEPYRTAPHGITPLSRTERQILAYVARGWGNKCIGERLNMHEKTVRNSLTTIYRKLDLESRAEALLYYWGIFR